MKDVGELIKMFPIASLYIIHVSFIIILPYDTVWPVQQQYQMNVLRSFKAGE